MVDLFYYFGMFKNIISTFFQDGIWVVGFFYLLIKIFDSGKHKQFSKYVLSIILVLLLIYSIAVSI